jgi:transcriptional regulator with XRE-family HTH domain
VATDAINEARQALGRELRAWREAAGMTQQELANSLGYSRPRVAGAEKGDSCALLFWQGCDKILKASGALLKGFEQVEEIRQRAAQQAAADARAQREMRARELSKGSEGGVGKEQALSGFSGRSHKFIAAYVGGESAERIGSRQAATYPAQRQWLECGAVDVGHSAGECKLYLWPFGVAIFHLVEDLAMSNISELALWRVRSYEENLAWATSYLRQAGSLESTSAGYVLGAYWIDDHAWAIGNLDTALRIMCTPRVLLQRDPGQVETQLRQAEGVERRLFGDGFEHDGIRSFGLSGVSIGYASWSGVVYHPRFPEQCLTEQDLVCCELATQAVWAYCEHINQQVEEGRDPVVSDEHGWRYLRGVRSRLTNPRPQETGQHRAMRDAIIETSGLLGHLDQAIDVLSRIPGR